MSPLKPIPDREKTSNAAYIEAISHPVRAGILQITEEREASAAELAAELDAPPRTVRHHLRRLLDGGFVAIVAHRARRNVQECVYRASSFGEIDDETYLALPPDRQKLVINFYLQSMTRGLTRFVAAASTYGDHHPAAARVRFNLDDEGWDRLMAICGAAAEEVIELRREVAQRLEERGEVGFEAEFDVIGIEVPETQTDRSAAD